MIAIERAESSDIVQLAALLSLLFSIEQDFAPGAERQQRALLQLLETPGAVIMVARTPDRAVVGMASGQLVISTAEGAPSIWIEDVVVTDAWRRKGVGRRLISAVETWATSRGAVRAQLLADRNNATALEFYRLHGWSKTQLVALRRFIDGRA